MRLVKVHEDVDVLERPRQHRGTPPHGPTHGDIAKGPVQVGRTGKGPRPGFQGCRMANHQQDGVRTVRPGRFRPRPDMIDDLLPAGSSPCIPPTTHSVRPLWPGRWKTPGARSNQDMGTGVAHPMTAAPRSLEGFVPQTLQPEEAHGQSRASIQREICSSPPEGRAQLEAMPGQPSNHHGTARAWGTVDDEVFVRCLGVHARPCGDESA